MMLIRWKLEIVVNSNNSSSPNDTDYDMDNNNGGKKTVQTTQQYALNGNHINWLLLSL